MGYNIGICETESELALCRPFKLEYSKVKVTDASVYGEHAEKDEMVTLEKAHELFPDWEAFIKRNRINAESDAIYLDKVKKDEDKAILEPHKIVKATGWVVLKDMSDAEKEKAISESEPENRISGWDMIDFDEMNGMCAKCELSWDKGRGCIGAFGPENGQLPQIAEKYGCPIIASVPVSVKEHKVFSYEVAKDLIAEAEKLATVLPDEGKMAVRRYSGPLERIKAMAEASDKGKCGFLFF